MPVTPYGVDFAFVSMMLFFLFFLGLVLYLRREDRREGYPLEEDDSGRVRTAGGLLFSAAPKTFTLPGGRGTVVAPDLRRDNRELSARRTSPTPGSPLEPTGNPMLAGVGPGAYAMRAQVPDVTAHGDPKIVPLRIAPDFSVVKGDGDPRGMRVVGTDGAVAGTVTDIWVDRAESMIRYLEVGLTGGESVLLPITVSMINKSRKIVVVDAITGAQFADVPKLASGEQITFDEEERVTAYYGGGFLYATPQRGEPLL